MHYREEPADNGSSVGVRVQLAYTGDEHRPGYSAREAVHVRIDRFACDSLLNAEYEVQMSHTLCPKLDTPQSVSEDVNVGY